MTPSQFFESPSQTLDSGDDGVVNPLDMRRRKRERDKQSQRRKRQREKEYIATLEARIRDLEKRSNEAIERRDTAFITTHQSPGSHSGTNKEDASRDPVGDFEPSQPHFYTPPTPSSALVTADDMSNSNLTSAHVPQHGNTSRHSSPSDAGDAVAVSLNLLDNLLRAPQWMRFPQLSFCPISGPRVLIRSERFGPLITQLRASPDLASSCPASPKMLDLLFGGSRNPIANLIWSEMTPFFAHPPEKLAISWYMYLYTKWLVSGSQETFNRVPDLLRPTSLQLIQKHLFCISVIPFPTMRDKLIRDWRLYNLEEVIGLLGCTVRIRGTSHENFLTRVDEGEPQFSEVFYQQFMRSDGWGLVERFWNEYPELVDGLDRSFLIREEQLLL